MKSAQGDYLRFFEQMYKYAPIGIALLDATGKWIAVNPFLCEMFGYTKEELLCLDYQTITHPDDLSENSEQARLLWAGELDTYVTEKRYITKQGTMVWASLKSYVVRDKKEKPLYYITHITDITERKSTEHKLKETEWLYNLISENVMDIIGYSTPDGICRYVTPSIYKVLGYHPEEIIGKDTLHLTHPDDLVAYKNEVFADSDVITYRLLHKDGHYVWLESNYNTLRDEHGRKKYVLGVTRNIDKEIKSQKQLEVAESVAKTKSDFLAMMSHEVRTPLNGILGLTELLRESKLDELQRESVVSIQRSGNALLSIINGILDFSKMESGHFELTEEPFRIESVITDVINLFQKPIRDKNLSLDWSCDSSLPQWIVGDETRFRQVLINLMDNAVKFTETGSICFEAECALISGDKVLRMRVKDSGIGIPQDRIEQILQPFTQVDSSPSRRFSGTGLGLTISNHLLHLMGGTLSIHSESGLGSEFILTIPLREPTELPAEDTGESNLSQLSEENVPLKILIAEDHDINRKVLFMMLRKLGYTVDVAEDGLQTVEAVQSKEYDLILMDIQMPVMDGMEAASQLRERLGDRCPVIIAVTANALMGDKEKYLAGGMDDYISKPVKLDALTRMIEKHFGKRI
ncbi:hypothetical protein SY83_18035 [Paenibacillus swuensis]|uniref:Circadian input-output histidine kinase CikA n=1 Tax=Paenibacillus swuensis TaxID=1178515 RepID=A0A172TM42_9BACL|nr:PAS domain S-box protein [Paenibacillus swuensis]ANE47877.1 hypothetical protein SY83_18035 [Paenibacillus swuensis]